MGEWYPGRKEAWKIITIKPRPGSSGKKNRGRAGEVGLSRMGNCMELL